MSDAGSSSYDDDFAQREVRISGEDASPGTEEYESTDEVSPLPLTEEPALQSNAEGDVEEQSEVDETPAADSDEQLLQKFDAETVARVRKKAYRDSCARMRRHYKASEKDDNVQQLGDEQPTEDKNDNKEEDTEQKIAKLREATNALSQKNDRLLLNSVKAVLLSQCAYRVPTGTDFWDHVAKIKDGKSRASVQEVYKKFLRSAVAWQDVVQSYLNAIEVCVGIRFTPFAQTALDVDSVKKLFEKEEQTAKRSAGSGDEEEEEEEEEEETDLNSIELPKIPPGWLVVREGEANIWVSVAGTQNPDDCFRDCMFIPTPLKLPLGEDEVKGSYSRIVNDGRIQVHAGFLDGALKVFEQVHQTVMDAIGDDSERVTVHFVGHSLGGATAILLAIFFSAWRHRQIKLGTVTTFGAPNLFYTEEVEDVRSIRQLLKRVELRQFVNDRDIVPRALGSPLIKKLAKLLIKVGVKELSNLTPENSNYILKYRLVAPCLYLMTPPNTIEEVPDNPKDREKVMSVGVLDCRPAAGNHHKIGAYIQRMLARLSELTTVTHDWCIDDITQPDEFIHPAAAIVYDKKDPSLLSSSFTSILGDIFNTLQKDGVLAVTSLRRLCHWSDKRYPQHLIQKIIENKKYETETPDSGSETGLSREGFMAFIEDSCYSDLAWVGRVSTCLQVGKGFEASGKTELLDDCGPLVEGEGGMLTEKSLLAAKNLFDTFSHFNGKQDVVGAECLKIFIRKTENYDTDLPVSDQSVLASCRAIFDIARSNYLAKRGKKVVEKEEGGNLQLEQLSHQISFQNQNSGGVNSSEYLTRSEFMDVIRRWSVDDELRMWRIYRGLGHQLSLEIQSSVTNIHDILGGCTCKAEREKEFDMKEKIRLMTEDLTIRRLRRLLRRASTAPKRELNDLKSSNQMFEKQIAELKKQLNTHKLTPSQEGTHCLVLRTERLQRENEQLQKRVSDMPMADTQVLQKRLYQMQNHLDELKKKNRVFTQRLKSASKAPATHEECNARRVAFMVDNEKQLLMLKRQLITARKEKDRLLKTKSLQQIELSRFPSDLPFVDLKQLQQVQDLKQDRVCTLFYFGTCGRDPKRKKKKKTGSENREH